MFRLLPNAELFFLLIVLLACLFFYLGTGRDRRVLLFYLLWIPLAGILACSGILQNTTAFPPRMLFIILPATISVMLLYRRLDPKLLKTNYLLALHSLRIPVELVLYKLYLAGRIPALMTFEGWNMDILSGISALCILIWCRHRQAQPGKRFFLFWNIAGLLLLAVIVSIALLSAPSPVQALAFDQPNTALLCFPYTLLPAVIVPLVLLAHLLSLKRLRGS